MINKQLDEYNYMIWTAQYEELKFLLSNEDIDFNDTDTKGKTLLIEAIESAKFYDFGDEMKPEQRSLDFIDWLLSHGADAGNPQGKNPVKHAIDCEKEHSVNGKYYDYTQIISLLKAHGADVSDCEEVMRMDFRERIAKG